MNKTKTTGVMTPILTPFNDDLSIAADLYLGHAKWLLAQGIHYIAPFGTTGEALSMSVQERLAAVDALIDGGIDPAVLMPGTGLCNLPETVTLCRHAIDRGCSAVMVLPPFFYKNASDDGLYNYFAWLIKSVDRPNLRICMYHIPPLAGIGFTPALAGRLAKDFPETIFAYKDSSGNFENTKAVIAAAPGISVFPGSELFLREGMEHGGMGCISATCNVNPDRIRYVFDVATGAKADDLDRVNNDIVTFRKTVEEYVPIPAMKGMLALQRGDGRWRNVRPPFIPASQENTEQLIAKLGELLKPL